MIVFIEGKKYPQGVYMSKTTMKAQLWDKTQYFLSNFYDRMMHYAIFYDGELDIDIIRKSVKAVVDKVPVLHSQYKANFVRPYWKIREDYTLEEMAEYEEVEDLEAATVEFLKGDVDNKSKLQFKCKVFSSKGKCSFATIVNHQCFDGSDYKYCMFKIVEFYNSYKRVGNIDNVAFKEGKRDLSQLYENMEPEIAKKAKGLYNNASKTGIKTAFRFTDDKDCKKRFIMKMIPKELFEKAKAKSKAEGASINDVMLAAYFRALVKEIGCKNDEPINITSMMDLRRHMLTKDTIGVTNMTAFMPCKLADGIGGTFEDTLARVKEQTSKQKNDDVSGLYGIPLLGLAYKLFWLDCIATFAIKLGYDNPLIQMSNLGILKAEDVDFDGCHFYDCIMTGAVKYKPYFQFTCVTREGHMKFCVAEKCSDKDEQLIRGFFDDMEKELEGYVKI